MAEPMTVTIITPDEQAFSGKARFISGRALDGEFGVYPNASPLVVALDMKPFFLEDEAGKRHSFAIFGGFLEVSNNQVTLVAADCQVPEEIDLERAMRAKARAEQRLADSQNPDIDVERAQLALRRALLRIHIAGL